MLYSRSLWLVLALVWILTWIGTHSELHAQQPTQSSYRLQTSVMGSAGSPGASGAKRSNGTMGQPTPIGVGSSSGKMVYAGLWSRPWVLSSILDTGGTLPLTTRIYQNFPNPFMNVTTIEYSVATGNLVEISVFNVKGQKVRTLVNEHASPGRYFTSWDGRTDTGDEASPGVYFYRMTVADHRSVKKMLLLR